MIRLIDVKLYTLLAVVEYNNYTRRPSICLDSAA